MKHSSSPRLLSVTAHRIVLQGQTISYSLRRSDRAIHARLEVRRTTGLTVVAPIAYASGQITAFLLDKQEWILEKLAKYTKPTSPASGNRLQNGDSIPYLGKPLKIVIRHSRDGTDRVIMQGRRLLFSLDSEDININLATEAWYRRQAAELLRQKADKWQEAVGVTYKRLGIRGAKTRWGSCSHKGNLNFNWKLLMTPEPVIDYVVIHELCHIKELNHSKNFWHLVAGTCPEWRKRRQWLNKHEAELLHKISG